MPVKFYTEKEMVKERIHTEVLNDMIRGIMSHQEADNERERGQDKEVVRKGYKDSYCFIANHHIPTIIDIFSEIKRQKPKDTNYKFLDVGCGVGNIMSVAKHIFWNCKGIELDRRNIERSKAIFGQVISDNIDNINAFDFQNYGDYDIIYYYCPIRNPKVEIELEKLIESKMKLGAFLVPFNKLYNEIHKNKNFKRIDLYGRFIFQKVKEGKKRAKNVFKDIPPIKEEEDDY